MDVEGGRHWAKVKEEVKNELGGKGD